MADLEHDIPNSPETIFEAGSVSKQFTATAIVLVSLEGKLSLADDVRSEAETTFIVRVDDGELVMPQRPDRTIPLAPVYRDAFRSSIGLIRFRRDDAGQATSFGLRQASVFDMRFFRIDE